MTLSRDQKKVVIETLKNHGTYTQAARAIKISDATLYNERKRNKAFGAECEAAQQQGRESVGDKALTVIEMVAFNPQSKDKDRLTAALSLANAFIPGFRNSPQTATHTTNNNLTVITGIPRPQYEVETIEGEYKVLPEGQSEEPQFKTPEAKRIKKREYMRIKRAAQAKNTKVTTEEHVAV